MNTARTQLVLKSSDSAKRYARFVISTEQPDSYKDVVVSRGCDLSEFARNPVVFIEHGRFSPIPIGKSADDTGRLDVEIFNDRIEAGCYFSDNEYGKSAYNLTVRDKVMRGASIGFAPKEYSLIKGGGAKYHSWALREWSITARPVNRECWAKAHILNTNSVARSILKSIQKSVIMFPTRQLDTKVINLVFAKSEYPTMNKVTEWIKEFNYMPKSFTETDTEIKAVFDESAVTDTVELATGIKAEVAEERVVPPPVLPPDEMTAGAKFCKAAITALNELLDAQEKSIRIVEDATIRDAYENSTKAIRNVVHSLHTVAKGKYPDSDWGAVPDDWGTRIDVSLTAKAATALRELVNPKRVLFKHDKDNYLKLAQQLSECGKVKSSPDDAAIELELKKLQENYLKLTGEALNV